METPTIDLSEGARPQKVSENFTHGFVEPIAPKIMALL